VANFLDMQTRIDDELDRGGTMSAQIKKAIVSAVAFYERKDFYFTESSFQFSTVRGQEIYTSTDAAAIATAPNIERLNGLFFGSRIPLHKRNWEYIDNISTLPISMAMPEDWAYRALTIRLYPIPDRAYTITAYDVPRLTMLSADTDSNAWTNDAEELIRARAKVDLIENVIRDPSLEGDSAIQRRREQEALTALYNEMASCRAIGMIQPTVF